MKRQTAWKQKDSFSCAHTLEQSQRQLFPSRVSQNLQLDLSLSISLFLIHSLFSLPCLSLIYESIRRERKGPTKVVQKRGHKLNQPPPPVYSALSCSDTPSSSDSWNSGARGAIQAAQRMQSCHKFSLLIRTDDFSAPTNLTHGGWGLCIMKGCKSKRYTVAAARGFALKGREHSNY